MTNATLIHSMEKTAARLLMAAERNRDKAREMRFLAAQLQAMTAALDAPDIHA